MTIITTYQVFLIFYDIDFIIEATADLFSFSFIFFMSEDLPNRAIRKLCWHGNLRSMIILCPLFNMSFGICEYDGFICADAFLIYFYFF
jgi:hypothetical protein